MCSVVFACARPVQVYNWVSSVQKGRKFEKENGVKLKQAKVEQ